MTDREAPRGSAVIGAGRYRVDSRRLILHTPASVKVDVMPDDELRALEAQSAAAVAEAEPAGPTPQEVAEQESARIVAEAREEAEALRRAAREEGFAEGLAAGTERGREEGRADGVAELREALDRWLTMGDALVEAWRARFDALEHEIKDLAVVAAEKLLEGSLAVAPEAVVAVVKSAMRHAAEADQVTVLVHPKDLGLVRAAKEELAAALKGTGRFEIVEDAKIEPGSCLVETKTQVIDATRKTRKDQLRAEMGGS